MKLGICVLRSSVFKIQKYFPSFRKKIPPICSQMLKCLPDQIPVRHTPEKKGIVPSTLVLCKKLPEYSKLADETYLNLRPTYMWKIYFSMFSFCGYIFGLKRENCLILSQQVFHMQNDQYLHTSEDNIKCLRLLCIWKCSNDV